MNYLRANREPDRAQIGKIILLVFVVVAIYLWGSQTASLVDRILSFVIYPFIKIDRAIGAPIDQTLNFFIQQNHLAEENERLKGENDRLKVLLLNKIDLAKANADLRNLATERVAKYKPIIAKVLAKPNQLPYDILLLDIGTNQARELKVGQLIFLNQNTILGQIAYVSSNLTKAKLYSTSGETIPVVIGDKKVPAVAGGQGNGNFSLSLPRGVVIKVGDLVKTSLIGDYLLGTVSKIYNDPNNPFQKIIFKSPINLAELVWVEIPNP
ncbi:MAG: rod shape-determining protein MreC [Patescibacteria group bacterium]